MLRGWLFAFSPARRSQGLAWRMSHPLGTGNSGTPIAPAWGKVQRDGGVGGGGEERGVMLQPCFDLNKTPFKGKRGFEPKRRGCTLCMMLRALHGGEPCPKVSLLMAGKHLER